MTGNGGSFGSSAAVGKVKFSVNTLGVLPLARPPTLRNQPFLNCASRRGLQLNLRPKLVAEKAFGGLPARNRTAMVGDLKSETDSKFAFNS